MKVHLIAALVAEWSAYAVIVAGFLLLMPSTLATSASGTLVLQGPTDLPAGAILTGEPLGIFTRDVAALETLAFSAPKARLLEYTLRSFTVETGAVPLTADTAPSWTETDLTDVRVELAAKSGEAWIGVYPDADSHATLTLGSPATMRAQERSQVGNTGERAFGPAYDAAARDGQPLERTYQRAFTAPHLLVSASGTLDYEGGGSLKVYGLDLQLTSRERSGTVASGVERHPGPPREDVLRWTILQFDAAAIEVRSAGGIDLAFPQASAAWSGPITFTSAAGELHTPEGAYLTEGYPATLDGDLTADLTPVLQGGQLVTYARVQGDLHASTLRPQAVAAPGGAPGSSSWPLVGVLAVLAGGAGAGAGTVLLLRRPRRAAPAAQPDAALLATDDGLQADDCVKFADEAAVERRWARALHWARRARVLAPTNGRIRADEGEYLFQLGMFEESLQAFAEASRLDPEEGYADYRGAQAAVAAGRPVDEVLGWLSRALEKSPDLVGDLELFKEFESLRGMAAYETMVLRAYERLGIDPAQPF